MLTALLTLLSGVLSGGATGLIGVALQRFFDFKSKQLDIEVVKLNHQNALALADKETERSRLRADADVRQAEEDHAARESEADSRSLVASFQHDKAAYLDPAAQRRKGFVGGLVVVLLAAVDFARGMLRPGLTIYLTVIVTMMFLRMLQLLQDLGHAWSSAELLPIVTNIVATILYCFTTCVVWWFGSRPKSGRER